jgi:hypothetical protein
MNPHSNKKDRIVVFGLCAFIAIFLFTLPHTLNYIVVGIALFWISLVILFIISAAISITVSKRKE